MTSIENISGMPVAMDLTPLPLSKGRPPITSFQDFQTEKFRQHGINYSPDDRGDINSLADALGPEDQPRMSVHGSQSIKEFSQIRRESIIESKCLIGLKSELLRRRSPVLSLPPVDLNEHETFAALVDIAAIPEAKNDVNGPSSSWKLQANQWPSLEGNSNCL
jgi:hypothetical protein